MLIHKPLNQHMEPKVRSVSLCGLLLTALLIGNMSCGSKAYQNDNVEHESATMSAVEEPPADNAESMDDTEAGQAGNAPAGADSDARIYGAQPTLASQPALGLREAIERTSAGEETIRLHGEVVDVCRKKGCWMMLRDGADEVRVTFKDYGFFVPVDLSGSEVTVEGVLQSKVLTEAEARHYAEDAGSTPQEIAAIVGDQTEYSFVATSVQVN